MSKLSYKDSGVDVTLGEEFVEKIKNKVKATYGNRVHQGVGGFASLYECGDRYLAAGTDGVGTKLKLAFDLEIYNTVGIDLVAMCVNDILCTGAKPLFFMDYLATGKLDVKISESIIEGIITGCNYSESALIGGETAEMPGFYNNGEFDLAGFSVGEVYKGREIDGTKVRNNDTIIALPSSGFHSNGFSLIRKLVKDDEVSLKKELLTPTKIYWQACKNLIAKDLVNGIAHITGGGIDNISRINNGFNYNIVDTSFLEKMPEFMKIITNRSKLPINELLKTFNMGIGLVLITSSPELVIDELRSNGEEYFVIGNVIKGNGAVLVNT